MLTIVNMMMDLFARLTEMRPPEVATRTTSKRRLTRQEVQRLFSEELRTSGKIGV